MDNERLVEWALGRKLYEQLAEYKGWTPNPPPYVDKGSQKIAATAISFLGYDDELAEELRKEIDPLSWVNDEYSQG